jgi:hypothetical protein
VFQFSLMLCRAQLRSPRKYDHWIGVHALRRILSQRPHVSRDLHRAAAADPNPAWCGHTVGHREGDTLVDRAGFDQRVSMDQGAHPHSDKLHIIETDATMDNPGVLAQPFNIRRVSKLAAGIEISEFICTGNERHNHHMGAGKR